MYLPIVKIIEEAAAGANPSWKAIYHACLAIGNPFIDAADEHDWKTLRFDWNLLKLRT